MNVDVAALPTYGFGRRSALYWGVLLVIMIESTALAIMFGSYLYVRGNFLEWPPSEKLNVLPGVLTTCVLVASCIPMEICRRRARTLDLRSTRLWLGVATVMSLVATALRAWEIGAIPFRWSDNAYASVVFMTYGTHATELVAAIFENVLLTVLFFKGPLEKKHYEDAAVNAVFWFFAALVWVPFALLFYLDGVIR